MGGVRAGQRLVEPPIPHELNGRAEEPAVVGFCRVQLHGLLVLPRRWLPSTAINVDPTATPKQWLYSFAVGAGQTFFGGERALRVVAQAQRCLELDELGALDRGVELARAQAGHVGDVAALG